MKKILLLGGSAQQLVAIETAKRLGYYTILCDYLPDNPGQFKADKFYQISTTDKEAVLDIAKKENVDGVLAYASDPAAPTAAYVAQELGLPGNPYESVEILCNKDRFRKFLSDNGFNTPLAMSYESVESVINDTSAFTLPVIVKPVDSSGSKGATVLHSWEDLDDAARFAFSFSRCHRVIVEEYIEKKHPYLIGGDIFVLNGKIILWGLLNCHRDSSVNPLVPVGKSYPPDLSDPDLNNVKNVLQRMITDLGMKFGAMNVELITDKEGKVFMIDVGPRNGGNMIPDLLSYIFGIDVVEMTVKSAMCETITLSDEQPIEYYATHNLHANKNGKFAGIDFTPEIEKYVVKKCIYKKLGDDIEFFDNATKALGIVFLKFPSINELHRILDNINEHIAVRFEV